MREDADREAAADCNKAHDRRQLQLCQKEDVGEGSRGRIIATE